MRLFQEAMRPLFKTNTNEGRVKAQLKAVLEGLELMHLSGIPAFEHYLERLKERMHLLQQLALTDKDPIAREEYRFRSLEQQEWLVRIYASMERTQELLNPETEAGAKFALTMAAHREVTGMPTSSDVGGQPTGGAQ